MDEMTKHGRVGLAALRTGMDRKTARKYLAAERLPTEMKPERTWRTREDPFERDWDEVEALVREAPGLQAKTIFEHLQELHPGRYQDGQLRTLQRRLKQWRAASGPERVIFFPQLHRPGEAMQTDFTSARSLRVSIEGVPYDHLLCHSVLPYSDWESATACSSESMPALKRGVQTALFRLGRVPRHHQTDHSTAATHRELGSSRRRSFNEEYLAFCTHFGMGPRTTAVGQKEQNGDVEASNGAFKNCLDQWLQLRGSRDFASVATWEAWLWEQCRRANRGREVRLREELEQMRPLPAHRLAEYSELEAVVSAASTIRVRRNTYSVPSRLIRERVKVRLYDTRIEVYYGGVCQLRADRLRGEANHRINYRHVIASLVRKPGAFERYRYRDDLFPNLLFRRSYDRLREALSERAADMQYLRVLQLAATMSEEAVMTALTACAASSTVPTVEAVKALAKVEEPEVPELAEIEVDLAAFDALLDQPLGRIG